MMLGACGAAAIPVLFIPMPLWKLKFHRRLRSALGSDTTRIDEMNLRKERMTVEDNSVEKPSRISGDIDGGVGEVAGQVRKELQQETESKRWKSVWQGVVGKE